MIPVLLFLLERNNNVESGRFFLVDGDERVVVLFCFLLDERFWRRGKRIVMMAGQGACRRFGGGSS